MASVFQNSVAEALAEQSWWARRKDTLTAIAGTILQVANLLILVSGGWPAWANAVIAGVIGLAQIVIHAGTKGAITPSMAMRLERAGERAHLDRPSVTGVAITGEPHIADAEVVTDPGRGYPGYVFGEPLSAELPIYTGETSAEYTGKHHASD